MKEKEAPEGVRSGKAEGDDQKTTGKCLPFLIRARTFEGVLTRRARDLRRKGT